MRDYFRARVLRIAPAFWVATLATLVVFGASGASLGRILAVFGFVGVYYPSDFFGRILQSWTVTSEAAFYLVLPLAMIALALVSRRLRSTMARAACSPTSCSRWAFASSREAGPTGRRTSLSSRSTPPQTSTPPRWSPGRLDFS